MDGTATRMWALDGPRMTLNAGMVMVGATETITIPVPCYLVQHPLGLVLFDTGLAPQAQQDPAAVYGALADAVEFHFSEEQLLENQLGLAGFRREDVTHVVCSHTHLDHTGGLHLFPQARFYAGAGDLHYALHPGADDAGLFRGPDVEAARGFDWTDVHGDLDLFGDGSIVLLHMPGHTPGNQSLIVRLPSRTFLLTGDTVHLRAALEAGVAMPTDYSVEQATRSVHRLRGLRESLGATVWIPHDPQDAAAFSFAPHSYE